MVQYLPKIVSNEPLRPQIVPPVLEPRKCVEWSNQPSFIMLVSFEVHHRILIVYLFVVHTYLASSSQDLPEAFNHRSINVDWPSLILTSIQYKIEKEVYTTMT